jgi:FixJ family two-component response regulator
MAFDPAGAKLPFLTISGLDMSAGPLPEPNNVMQVAVVDDDAGVRGALGRLLRVSGYGVQIFASAEEFLEFGRPAELDCLIVDVYLGGMSGSDLHAELTASGRVPPTVLVTAHDDAAIAAMVRRSEEVICLRKPFDDSSLLFAIGCVTGRLGEAGAG